MATTAATQPLQDLAHRIARQEATLAKLRRRLDSRLADLNRRREDLRARLRAVEAEIAAASPNGQAAEQPTPVQAPPAQAATHSAKRRARSGSTLAEFLIGLVSEGNGEPVPVATLKAETVRRRFPTSSSNIPALVETRAWDLARRGLLRRDPATGGFLLPEARNGGTATATTTRKRPAASKQARKGGPQARNGQPSLRSVLLDILKKAGRTLSAQELADQAQQAGYRSQSKDFKSVIWVAVRNMPEVEHDPEGGYRLKKRKG
jgi:hypothetical protein